MPSLLDVSFSISTLKEVKSPGMARGFVVTILIVEPMPPDGNLLFVDLYTSTAATP